MTPEDALNEAQSAELRPVYLLVGEETHRAEAVLRGLRKAAIAGGVPGLNEDQMIAGETSIDAVLSAARTLPMLSRRRFVCVKALERWEGRSGESGKSKAAAEALDRLAEYVKDPAPTTTLVLLASKLDNRRKLVAVAKQAGFFVACDPLARGELPVWIERTARERGATLGPEVAELIAELAGPELSSVSDALERVCLYADANAPVSVDDVTECVVRVRPATVWELLEAVGRRDLGAALAALSKVFDPSDRGLRLLSVLAWSTRQMLRFESAWRKGADPTEAAKTAGAPPFKARELMQQVKRIPRAELEAWLELLGSVDLALKGGSKRSPQAVLEEVIVRLCKPRPGASPGASSRAPA